MTFGKRLYFGGTAVGAAAKLRRPLWIGGATIAKELDLVDLDISHLSGGWFASALPTNWPIAIRVLASDWTMYWR